MESVPDLTELKRLTVEIDTLMKKHEKLLSPVIDYLYEIDVNSPEYRKMEDIISTLIPSVHEEYYTFI